MKPFEIFIAYVSWGSDGKCRPMLVYKTSGSDIMAFPITTQYASKPTAIKALYFVIDDWAQTGLDKQSYVDTGTPYVFSESSLENIKPIGRLTERDKRKLIQFLLK